MATQHTKWRPRTPEDWGHVLAACNELINYAWDHEDADDDDRPKMHRAMLYVANSLEKSAERAADRWRPII